MSKNKIIFLVFSSIILILGCYGENGNQSQLVLLNEANMKIIRANIEVCNQNFILKDIDRNEKKILFFNADFDSTYKLEIEFKNGKILKKSVGYVTNGIIVNHKIFVKSDNVLLSGEFEFK